MVKQYKIVVVKWEDSSNWRGWRTIKQCKEYLKPATCYSIWILVKRTKNCIAVTHSLGDGDYGDIMAIPRKCVKSVEIVSTFRSEL